jgi:hypothetical protein
MARRRIELCHGLITPPVVFMAQLTNGLRTLAKDSIMSDEEALKKMILFSQLEAEEHGLAFTSYLLGLAAASLNPAIVSESETAVHRSEFTDNELLRIIREETAQ